MRLNEKTFFHDMATRLHNEGVLKSYETPQGRDAGWPSYVKRGHGLPGKNKPGLVHHVGDEPYNELTTAQAQYYRDMQPLPVDLKLRTASVMKAIRAYMPDDDFQRYLEHFTATLKEPEHLATLRECYKNITEQFTSYRGRASDAEFRAIIRDPESTPNDIRAACGESQMAQEAGKAPELLLSVAIYQAAQAHYVKKLGEAIEGHPAIPDDEKDNASAVIREPFKQFATSLLFAAVVPLARLAEQDMPKEQGENKDSRMRRAITEAWKMAFDGRVLTRRYSEQEIPPDKAGGKVEYTCPAINILRGS